MSGMPRSVMTTVKGPAGAEAGTEHFQALAAAWSDADLIMIAFQTVVEEFAHGGFIVNAEDAKGEARRKAGGYGPGRGKGGLDNGEDEADAGALARRAFDFDGAFVALHHAVNHGQSEAGSAALALWWRRTVPDNADELSSMPEPLSRTSSCSSWAGAAPLCAAGRVTAIRNGTK